MNYEFLVPVTLVFFIGLPAAAGTSERVSNERPEAPGLESAIQEYQTKIDQLDQVNLSVPDYKKLVGSIVDDFIKERTPVHESLRASEVLRCKVEAKRPGLFDGRNRDSCRISNDLSYFEGWVFSGKEEKLVHQYTGGSNNHSVSVDEQTGSIVLAVNCTSPSQDDFSGGRCGRTQEVTISYRKGPELVDRDVRLEVNNLVFW